MFLGVFGMLFHNFLAVRFALETWQHNTRSGWLFGLERDIKCSYRFINSNRRFAVIRRLVLFRYVFEIRGIPCNTYRAWWWRGQSFQSAGNCITSDNRRTDDRRQSMHLAFLSWRNPDITYLQLLSCDRIKEFFGDFFFDWIEGFPWLMLCIIALIKEFDSIYMNFLTSPKTIYSSEVVFTICDVRKVDLNRFNTR